MSKAKRASASASGPRIVAVGSGSGGSGRTTLSLELARAFHRRGLKTVIVDCALNAPVAAAVLGHEPRPRRPGQPDLASRASHLQDFVTRPGSGNGPGVLTLRDSLSEPERLLGMEPGRFVERLRRLEDDVVVIDLPAGLQPFWSGVLPLADVPLVISGPEAWSVRCLWPFLAELTEGVCRERPDDPFMRTYLVLNGCRDASERELGEVLCHALWRKLGHYPRYLGPIDFDDRRWFHLRHGEACPGLSSADGHGVQVEELTKRILALEDFDERRPRPVAGMEGGGAGWMGLSPMASATDLRAQYRRLWEGYRRESAVSQVLISAEDRAVLISELERTYRALQMALDENRVPAPAPAAGKPAERPVTPAALPLVPANARPIELRPAEPSGRPGPPPAASRSPVDPLADRGAAHCGELLARRRHERDMALRELSLRTRISLKYLEAIEGMETEALPPPVYLRGYLREIARVLDFPVESLLDRYLTELAEVQKAESSGIGA